MGGPGSGRKPKKQYPIYKGPRNRINSMERMEFGKQNLAGIGESPFLKGLVEQWEAEKSGIGVDIAQYMEWSNEAADAVHSDPTILDIYSINIETGHDPTKNMPPLDPIMNLIYFRANPWVVAEKVFGIENLNKACALASKFKGFTPFQKQFLRDSMDPRKMNMIFTACRSGAKTWLTALAVLTMSYLMPKIRIMIISGSQEQSDNLYRYFRDIAEGTPYQRLVKEAIYKTKTDTLAGGWVRAFPASHKKVHGPRPDVVVGDELCKAESDIILAAYSAAMSAQSPKFIAMSTPDAMEHIFHEWAMEAEQQSRMTPVELALVPAVQRWHYYHLTAYECPWITPEAIEALTHKYGGRTSHEYKIYVLGQFAPAEGLVFNEEWIDSSIILELPKTVTFDTEDETGNIVTIEDEIALSFHTTGLDVGSKHPTGIVVACEDQLGNVYIIDNAEVSGRSGDEPIIAEVHRKAQTYTSGVWADAAPIQTFTNKKIKKKLAEDNLPTLHVISFKKEKTNMISVVRGLMESGKIFILKRKCEKLINQLYTYAYDEREDVDMPAKGNDDHVDAFLLAVWPHRRTYLKTHYKKSYARVFNMDRHMEHIERNPYIIPNVNNYM